MSAAETMQELPETSEADIRRLVDMQKAAHIAEGPMTAERRIDLIDRTIALIVDNGDAMVDALMADFGNRSPEGTLATDVGGTLGALKYAKKNVRKWMKASSAIPCSRSVYWVPARGRISAARLCRQCCAVEFPVQSVFRPDGLDFRSR